MADIETEISLVTSDNTIDSSEIEHIIDSLDTAAKDAKESGDYLTFSTVVDIHFLDPSKYTEEERELLLNHLLKILQDDDDFVYEVGWDLPAVVIPFVDSDYDVSRGPLRNLPGFVAVFYLFGVLAEKGNPKELFLKSTELLLTMKVTDSPDPKNAEQFYDLKFYCVFELINSTLRRINTFYPSRFLGMIVTSFINSIYVNPVVTSNGVDFLWKRVYAFLRNYSRPPIPKNTDLSAEELANLNKDEDYLQRKLLTAFLTESISRVLVREILGLSVVYFKYLQSLLPQDAKVTSLHELNLPVVTRLNELALSFDIDTSEVFKDFLKSTDELVNFDASKDSDEKVSEDLFGALVVDYQKNFAQTLVNSEANEVSDSLGGIITLRTFAVVSENDYDSEEVSLTLAIKIGLRLIVPGLVHQAFLNRGQHDVAVFWAWRAVHSLETRGQSLKLELATIPKVLLTGYFLSLLYATSNSGQPLYFRFIVLTLLTKLLRLAPESTSYEFLANSLEECPYEDVKAPLVGILKELISQTNTPGDQLAETLLTLTVGDKPPLPERKEKAVEEKYISLSKSRLAEIAGIVENYAEQVVQKDDTALDPPSLNTTKFPTFLALLNLLVYVKRAFKSPEGTFTGVIEKARKSVAQFDQLENSEPDAVIVNAVGVLKVTLDRLEE